MIRLKDILIEQSEIALPKVSALGSGKLKIQDPETNKVYIFQLQVDTGLLWTDIIVTGVNIDNDDLNNSTISYKHPVTGSSESSDLSKGSILTISKRYKTNKEIHITTKKGIELRLMKMN